LSKSTVDINNIKEEISRITAELSQLSNFTRINYTGFIKILKKHDKHTEYMLKPTFMLRLNSRPIYLENLDSLIYRLSKLYDRIRREEAGQSRSSIKESNTPGLEFIRKTSKYWVHSDNVTDVKCATLKCLPVLVFPTKRHDIDFAVSSVYLDNDQLELYIGRLEKTEGAIAIRIRWYGSEEPNEVFIERKIHREDWTGEVSIKSRFPLKEHFVNDYLCGELTSEDIMRRMRKESERSEDEIQEIGHLANEIQQVILSKKLKPVLRTFYNRTAFQLPGDARVRISLDTELCMIREDGPDRSGSNWKREDITTFPFDGLCESEICRFPHAILEVKLQIQSGQEAPKWAQDLVNGPLVL